MEGIGSHLVDIGKSLVDFKNSVSKLFSDVVNGLGNIITGIQTFASSVADFFGTLFDNLSGFFENVVDTILDIPSSIISGIETLLKFLFIPEDGFFEDHLYELRHHFSFADSFAKAFEYIVSLFDSEAQAPTFHFDFSSLSTSWDYGGKDVVVNMNWFDPWRDTVKTVISCFMWLVFAVNTYRDLPGIINGAGSAAHSTAGIEKELAKGD